MKKLVIISAWNLKILKKWLKWDQNVKRWLKQIMLPTNIFLKLKLYKYILRSCLK